MLSVSTYVRGASTFQPKVVVQRCPKPHHSRIIIVLSVAVIIAFNTPTNMRYSLIVALLPLFFAPVLTKLPEDCYWYFGRKPSETCVQECQEDYLLSVLLRLL